jgi:DNA-binding NarL/FixJ family response regulator
MPERKISVGEASDRRDAIAAAAGFKPNVHVIDFALPSLNGLVSMRERAELIRGQIEFLKGGSGGALVRMTLPLTAEETHAGA